MIVGPSRPDGENDRSEHVTQTTPREPALDRADPELFDIHAQLGVGTYLRRLWDMRDFVVSLPAANLKGQLFGQRLGVVWLLLNPLFFSLVFYFVFGVLFETSRGVGNFPAFLVVGLFAYHFTQRSITSCLNTVYSNRSLMQTLSFPRAALPLASTLGELYIHIPGLFVMIAIALLTGVRPHPAWLLIVPAAVIQTFFNLGVGMIAARASFHVRDLQQLAPHLLRVWLYVSGVVFPADLLAEKAGGTILTIFEANPIWIFLSMYRDAVIDGRFHAWTWAWGMCYALGATVIGFVFFRGRERSYSSV